MTRHDRIYIRILVLPLALLGSLLAHADEKKLSLHIAPQSLTGALNDYADAANVQLSYPAHTTTGLRSRGLEGEYTPSQALHKLMAGSGLTARPTASGAITLVETGGMMTVAETLPATVSPEENGQTMPKVTVEADYENPSDTVDYDTKNKGYTAYKAYGATKSDTPILDTPMAVQVIPRDLIDDRVTLKSIDTVRNVSGVQSSPNTFYDQFQIRGFDSGYGVTFRNGLQLEGTFGAEDSAFVDRIEVVKGPAAMLYGRIEPGGFVNIVTRKPLPVAAYNLQQQFGSFDMFRTTLDATGPITDDGKLLYRFIGVNDIANTWINFARHDNQALSGAISYKPNDQFEFNVNVEYYNMQFSDRNFFGKVPFVGGKPANMPRDFSLNGRSDEDIPNTVSRPLVGFDWTYKFNDDWKVNHKFHYTHLDETQTHLDNFGFDEATREFTRGFIYNKLEREVFGTNLNINGKFDTGIFKHNLLVGFDWFLYTDDWLGFVGQDTRIPNLNIDHPEYPNLTPVLFSIGRNSLTNVLWKSKEEDLGVYVQDQVSFDDRVFLLLSGRYDWGSVSYANIYGMNTETCFPHCDGGGMTPNRDEAFSPRAALLYKLTDFSSLFFSYSRSFGLNNGISGTGAAFDPEIGTQYEFGGKAEFFDGRLTTTATFFDLTKTNVSVAEPTRPGVSHLIGEINSRGVEFDVAGQITKNLSLIGSYTYDSAKITANFDPNKGNRYRGVAPNAASLWAKYDSNPEAKNGWSLGSGIYVIDQREGNDENTNKLPGYVRWDAMAGYRFNIGKANLSLQLNVNNLLDKKFFEATDGGSTAFPGMPRSFIGSVRVDL